MDIDALLNKYFEGETSCEEERRLRHFFAHGNVPPHLAPYKALFGYFDSEIEKLPSRKGRQLPFSRKTLIRSLSGVAAAVLFLIGVYTFRGIRQDCLCAGNYVIINGRCYADKQKAKEYALQALRQVSSSPDEWMIDLSDNADDKKIVENELNRLGEMFDGPDF